MTDDILFSPASSIALLLKEGEISSRELLDMTLRRIEEENSRINAVVTLDVAHAREQAEQADKRLQSGEGGALEGLVVTIKDSIDVTGMTSTSGAPAHRDRIPDRDAAAVARLRREGVVFVGKTNVPIFTGDFQSFNSLFGATNNPWDITRSPGGSSGGAAAAVATGMSTFEIGSDFAGSIRWPAHACGIFGHRPTYGLVSTRGHVPPPPGATFESEFSVMGPMARSAGDLKMILERIYGPADIDTDHPVIEPSRIKDPAQLRVAVWASDPDIPTDSAVSAAVREAAAVLAGMGAQIDENARPDFPVVEQLDTFSLFNHAIIASGFPEEVRMRIAERAKEFSPDDRSHRALQARGARPDAETWGRLQQRKASYIRAWQAFFEKYDVLLCPPAAVPAIPHDHRSSFHERTVTVDGQEKPYFDFLYWASLASLSGLPGTVAPITRSKEGLPLGVQIISAPGRDMTTIAIAGLLEESGRRFVPPPRN